ncbi:aquaporin [Bifidobacterium sp. MA2]|uniref:Aquaporin n=1 Tax=Bifidobacterium santillanense TaxID=2809028 RepID=A0ABS5ULN8_9BIFI|nr:aquaporin [Bifidobacterium santillanense]MBT1171826.1 aquaporin [Bifidobacterium santillanense]
MTSQETVTKEQPWPLRVGAELIGTFLICFAVYVFSTFGSIIFSVNLAYLALGTGLAYAAAVYALGWVSGGHFNPAVTVAAMLTGRTRIVDGVLYIVFQTLGAALAGLLVRFLLPTSSNVTLAQWLTTAVNGFDKGSVSYTTLNQYGLNFSITQAIAVEVVAGLLIVGVAMATYGTRKYAPATGVAYTLAAAVTFPVTGAALNPARATGIALVSQNQSLSVEPLSQLWVFWICPVLAAALVALAMIIMQMAHAPRKKGDDPAQLGGYDEAAGSDGEPTADASSDDPDGSQQVSAEVEDEKSESEADADGGVERH